MLKINYKLLNSDIFNKELSELTKKSGFSNFKASYNVAKIARKFTKELGMARGAYADWIKEYLVKEEDGKFKLSEPPNQYTPYQIQDGKEEEVAKKVEDFFATELEIEAAPITLDDLGSIQLTPHQILVLEPIFDPSSFAQQEV